jgi:hypothetical protein
MANAPRNAVIVSGPEGINELLAKVYHQWELGGDWGIVWHVGDYHDPESDCDCPKIIFTMKPLPQWEFHYAENGPVD